MQPEPCFVLVTSMTSQAFFSKQRLNLASKVHSRLGMPRRTNHEKPATDQVDYKTKTTQQLEHRTAFPSRCLRVTGGAGKQECGGKSRQRCHSLIDEAKNPSQMPRCPRRSYSNQQTKSRGLRQQASSITPKKPSVELAHPQIQDPFHRSVSNSPHGPPRRSSCSHYTQEWKCSSAFRTRFSPWLRTDTVAELSA